MALLIVAVVGIILVRNRVLVLQLRGSYGSSPQWSEILQTEAVRLKQRLATATLTLFSFGYELMLVLALSALYCVTVQGDLDTLTVLYVDPVQVRRRVP
jgi:hypothetical protein